MKRLWTIEDLKGFIKRYAPQPYVPEYYASWIDFLNTGDHDIGLQTQEVILADDWIAVSNYADFLDWFKNHPNIRFWVQGYISESNLIPMYLLLDESGNKVLLVCRNTSTNQLESMDLRECVDTCVSGHRELTD